MEKPSRFGRKRTFGQQTPRRWGWGTPLKKRTVARTWPQVIPDPTSNASKKSHSQGKWLRSPPGMASRKVTGKRSTVPALRNRLSAASPLEPRQRATPPAASPSLSWPAAFPAFSRHPGPACRARIKPSRTVDCVVGGFRFQELKPSRTFPECGLASAAVKSTTQRLHPERAADLPRKGLALVRTTVRETSSR
jgi:hypothetical protein